MLAANYNECNEMQCISLPEQTWFCWVLVFLFFKL